MVKYQSTRDQLVKVSAAQAIAQGISTEGGLFVPELFPHYSLHSIAGLVNKSYCERAEFLLKEFLEDFSDEEIAESIRSAYRFESFPVEEVAPVKRISNELYALELWHGPTSAFKDMALQLLPYLLTKSVEKLEEDKEIVILVATSGDTGKAALEGFRDVKNTRILVFYPTGGVSPIQYLQMATQEGENLAVFGVDGNFDDTQTAVKEIFTDPVLKEQLAEQGLMFSSANSINWGRLLPQIVYYFSAYLDLVKIGEVALGEKINISVPTGNFGNILAAYYAKQMGLPVHMLICASNENHVLTDFIKTGVYDRRREFVLTSSPSMDILISSNLERLLFALHNDNSNRVTGLMEQLKTTGNYEVEPEILEKLQREFYGGYCDETETAEMIQELFSKKGYLCDPHTAVAFQVYQKYQRETGDTTKTIVVSTANLYKFAGSILNALDPTSVTLDEFQQLERLQQLSGMEIPLQIANLDVKPKRFTGSISRSAMQSVVEQTLGIDKTKNG